MRYIYYKTVKHMESKIVRVTQAQIIQLVENVVKRYNEPTPINEGKILAEQKVDTFTNVVKVMDNLVEEIKKAKNGTYDKNKINESLDKIKALLVDNK